MNTAPKLSSPLQKPVRVPITLDRTGKIIEPSFFVYDIPAAIDAESDFVTYELTGIQNLTFASFNISSGK